MADAKTEPRVPTSFWQYIRSLGPGLVVALTWLGAGDLVDSAVAGGNYGYTLMWAMALALFVRFVFVSIIAKYQLCNQHGESVLSGLKRVHAAMPLFVAVVAVIFGHIYGSFLVRGLGLASEALFRFGDPFAWSAVWVTAAAVFVYRGLYRRLEAVFYVFLALLGVSVIGVAAWSGPDPVAAAKGVLLFDVPEQQGSYGALLVITSLIGAVGGSIANLLYPYFIQQKGWRGPRFRRVQLYDLAFGVGVLVFLNLSVWTIGAEVLHARGETIESLADLAKLLTIALGDLGAPIFYVGVFAAVYSSVIGMAMGFGYLVTDAVRVHRTARDPARRAVRRRRPPRLPNRRRVVPVLAAGLEPSRSAGLHLPHHRRQRGVGDRAADPLRRPVDSDRAPSAHRRRVAQQVVGERLPRGAVRAVDLGGVAVRRRHCRRRGVGVGPGGGSRSPVINFQEPCAPSPGATSG